ncbi:MAG TPA: MarR family winged helix-turn-helix transcriptional regulator [Polyangiaceae bacterium]|jgi:DNA-binding MarR family transcriptional regulator|nr:MarR family winged helix-turn-helix transcriptional regulator [Polyangiaceae bacterium]
MGSQALRRSASKSPVPRGPAPPGVREVLNSLRHIVRSLRVGSRAAEQQVGLSGAQLFVLQCLARQSPCTVGELAARTATDQSSVSVVVSRLVTRGHVRRAASKTDRRCVELSLTRSGRALLERAPRVAQDSLLLALEQLPSRELGALSRILAKVVDGSEVAAEAPALFFEDGPVLVRAKGSRRHV